MQLYVDKKIGFFAVFLKNSNILIGNCGISIQNIDGINEFEIGYYFNKNHWGLGYASEATIAMKHYGFKNLNLKKLCSYITKDNFASRAVAEKNGMKLEKLYNNPLYRNLPTTVYSILNPIN